MNGHVEAKKIHLEEPFISSETLIDELDTLRSLVPEVETLSSKYQNLNRLQEALFTIAELSGRNLELEEFYQGLHRIIGNLLYAENFFICLKNEKGKLTIVYLVDRYDGGELIDMPSRKLEQSLIGYLIKHQEPVLADRQQFVSLINQGRFVQLGTTPEFLLGAPMQSQKECIGAVVVQSYDSNHGYDTQDLQVLEFVAHHLAQSIERAQYRDSLEKRVAQRTQELTQANKELQREIKDRQRSEQLQRALFHISEAKYFRNHQ